MNTIVRNGVMLGAFALVTTGLIGVTFFGTEARIEQQKQQRLLSILNEVVPQAVHDNELYADCIVVSDPMLGRADTRHRVYRGRLNNAPSALVLEATAPDGYSGDIDLVIGVSTDMLVLGVRAVDHQETPGLGDKIELAVSNWVTDFNGEQFDSDNLAKWQVKKDGGEFDQFTGATITPRAVVHAVKQALMYAEANQQSLFSAPSDCATVTGDAQ